MKDRGDTMTTLLKKFLEKALQLFNSNPKRREPGDGSDGYCDCIGYLIGSLRRTGLTWTGIHGSNWAARKEAVNLHKVSSINDLEVGDMVLKGCNPGTSGYSLPSRYKKGGAYYNGDLTDYYHAGLVYSKNPFQIRHMSSKMTIDTKLGKWNYAARLRPLVNAGAYKETTNTEPVITPSSGTQAKVTAPSGSTVNFRKTPSLRGALIMRIPLGTIVEIVQPGEEWCKIKYDNKTGYMMAKFLEIQ